MKHIGKGKLIAGLVLIAIQLASYYGVAQSGMPPIRPISFASVEAFVFTLTSFLFGSIFGLVGLLLVILAFRPSKKAAKPGQKPLDELTPEEREREINRRVQRYLEPDVPEGCVRLSDIKSAPEQPAPEPAPPEEAPPAWVGSSAQEPASQPEPEPAPQLKRGKASKKGHAWRRATIALGLVCCLLLGGGCYLLYLNSALSSENITLLSDNQTLRATNATLERRNKNLEADIKIEKQQREHAEIEEIIAEVANRKLKSIIGFVVPNSRYYHTDDCPVYEAAETFWVHNVEYCEHLGYSPCPDCKQ